MLRAVLLGILVLLPAVTAVRAEEILPDAGGAERFFALLRKHSPLPGDRRAAPESALALSLTAEETAPEADNLDLLLGKPKAMYLGPKRGRPIPLLGRRFTVYAPIPVAPTDRVRADWSVVLSAVRLGRSDTPEVAAALQRIGKAPELDGDPRLPYLQGILAFRSGDLEAASGAFRTAADTGDLMSRKLLAVTRLEAGDVRGASKALEETVKEHPDDAVLRTLYGESLSRCRRHREAIPHLEFAVEADPGNGRTRTILARSLLLTGDAEMSLTVLEPILTGETPLLGAVVLAARGNLRLGRTEAAKKLTDQVREIAPNSSRATAVEVSLKLKEGDRAAALDVAKDWAAKSPNRPAVLRVWTYSAIANGDAAEAEKAARSWITAAPKSGLPKIGLARALLLGERAKEAHALLLSIRKDHPRLAAAESLLGDACVKLGEVEKGRKHYEAYLELVPKGSHADRIRERLSELR